jgi:uncharacterized protein
MPNLAFVYDPKLDVSVCKLEKLRKEDDISRYSVKARLWSLSYFPGEISLVCDTSAVPENLCLSREDNWKVFKVEGVLDFSLIGILAEIATILKNAKVSLYCISSYDTDWILVKANDFDNAIKALMEQGHQFKKVQFKNA